MKELHKEVSSTTSAEAVETLFQVATLLTDLMDSGLADQGLTRARAEVIWVLGAGQPMTQRDLAEVLRCTPRNVTGLVDPLEKAGLVTRVAHPTDRRATLVGLTAQGVAAAAEWRAGLDGIASALFAGFTDGEIAAFRRRLVRIAGNLRAVLDSS